MSVDGETLSAITGMEEACATARARVEDLVAELDDLRRCLRSVIAQRDEARAERDNLERIWEVPYCACGRQLTECDGSRAGCLVSTGKIKDKDKDK